LSGNVIRLISSAALLAILASCTSTSGKLDLGLSSNKPKTPDPSTPVVVQGACPQVYLRDGTAVYTEYAKGAKKNQDGSMDADKLIVQATLDQTTRQCHQTDQGLVITVQVHGIIVTGPAGKDGTTYHLPIRVAATDGDTTIYSELSKFDVTIPPGQGNAQFVFTKDNVMLNDTSNVGLARLFAGIDTGPVKPIKKKKS
jgi:hypothetical protein